MSELVIEELIYFAMIYLFIYLCTYLFRCYLFIYVVYLLSNNMFLHSNNYHEVNGGLGKTNAKCLGNM